MNRKAVLFLATAGLLAFSILPRTALSQTVPQLINYQGRFIDHAGMPVSGDTIQMRFAFLDGDTAGAGLLWSETQESVTVQNGIYSVLLGSVNPIPPSALAAPEVYLEVRARGEIFSPRQRVTSAPFAHLAAALAGDTAGVFYTKADVDALITGLQAQIDAMDGRVTVAEGDIIINQGDIADIATAIDGNSAKIATNQADIDTLETKLQPVTVAQTGDTVTDVYFTDVNVNIRSGSGFTDGAVNGRGNLIVGYNELRGSGDIRTGSHNIIVGTLQNYSSFGGLVAGYKNTVSGRWASVSGGSENIASGWYSSISGGTGNNTSDNFSSVSGGQDNTASGDYSHVSGGRDNLASGNWTSVAGGGGNYSGNHAYAHYSAVLGGKGNFTGDSIVGDRTLRQHSTQHFCP